MRRGDIWTRANGQAEPMLVPGEFNDFLRSHGEPAIWWRSEICPCVGAASDNANYTHELCQGLGWIWSNPVELTVSGLNDSTKILKNYFGTQDPGSLAGTVPTFAPDGQRVLVGVNDRFFFPRRTERQDLRKVKGDGDPNSATAEILWGQGVQQVISCRDLVRTYTFGVDFTITAAPAGSIIEWLEDGDAPSRGAVYTISFEIAPWYFVGAVKFRAQAGNRLPQYLMLNKVTSLDQLRKFHANVTAEAME